METKTKNTNIETNINTFLTRYSNDLETVYKNIQSIDNSLSLDINCEYLDLDKIIVSYYSLFLIFAKNIISQDYQKYLETNFKFYKMILKPNLINSYNEQIKLIEKLINKPINKIDTNFKINSVKIQKLNNLIDDKCPNLKEAFSIISINDFNSLPQEIIKNYTKLYEHRILYCSFSGFSTIEHIKKNLKYKCLVKFSVQEFNHQFHIYVPNKNILSKISKKLLKRIAVQIYFCYNHFGNKTKIPDYTIYYTNLKKEVPILKSDDEKIVFRPVHINTAVTDNNKQITIWRKEELLKSIFHEAIHFYNLDIKDDEFVNFFKQYLINTFKIDTNSTLLIFESLTELNASLLNTIFNSYYLNKKKTLFLKTFKSLIYKEIIFSIQQSSKILRLNNFKSVQQFKKKSPKNIIVSKKKKSKKRKKTMNKRHLYKNQKKIIQIVDVVSYHILKSIFLFNLDEIYKINKLSKTYTTENNMYDFYKDINFNDNNNFKNKLVKLITNNTRNNNGWSSLVNKQLKKKISKKNKSMRMTYYVNDDF